MDVLVTIKESATKTSLSTTLINKTQTFWNMLTTDHMTPVLRVLMHLTTQTTQKIFYLGK